MSVMDLSIDYYLIKIQSMFIMPCNLNRLHFSGFIIAQVGEG